MQSSPPWVLQPFSRSLFGGLEKSNEIGCLYKLSLPSTEIQTQFYTKFILCTSISPQNKHFPWPPKMDWEPKGGMVFLLFSSPGPFPQQGGAVCWGGEPPHPLSSTFGQTWSLKTSRKNVGFDDFSQVFIKKNVLTVINSRTRSKKSQGGTWHGPDIFLLCPEWRFWGLYAAGFIFGWWNYTFWGGFTFGQGILFFSRNFCLQCVHNECRHWHTTRIWWNSEGGLQLCGDMDPGVFRRQTKNQNLAIKKIVNSLI